MLRLHEVHGNKRNKVKNLKGDYIKIETLDKHYRPFYQELKNWPVLNLWGQADQSPFESELENKSSRETKTNIRKFSRIDSRTNHNIKSKTVGTTMTRKSRPQGGGGGATGTNTGTTTTTTNKINQKSRSGSDKQCGYCEICHLEYDVLKIHLKSDEHLKFVRDDDNFKSLDKLIECGANVKQFLNSQTKKHMTNGVKRNHLGSETDETDNSDVGGVNNSCNGDIVHENNVKTKRKCTKTRKSTTDGEQNRICKVQATRIRGLRWCAPSPESRPPIKEPPVYKVEKKEEVETNSNTNSNQKKLDIGKKQVVVKLKRVRQSELSLLNNEAEQFMFPKTPTYSESETDDERNTSEQSHRNNTKNYSFDLTSSDNKDSPSRRLHMSRRNFKQPNDVNFKSRRHDKRDEHQPAKQQQKDNNDANESGGGGTKSRFQATPIQPCSLVENNLWGPDDRMGDRLLKSPGGTVQSRWLHFRKKYQSLERDAKFNFERVPHNEPWYVTFQRQDMGREYMYEYFGNSSYHKLPYEMGALPPLAAGHEECCKLEQFILPPKSKGGQTPRKRGGCSAYPRIPSIAKVNDRTRSSTAAIIEATKVADLGVDETTNDSTRALPLKKRKLLLDDFPRKSPREHPSTLAILSSLTNQSVAAPSTSINMSRRYRDRLSSQLSIDDEDSNSTMTSQQTSKTEKESVLSATTQSLSINYFNVIKLNSQIDEMLDVDETNLLDPDDVSLDHLLTTTTKMSGNGLERDEQDDESNVVLICKNNDKDLLQIMNECADEELTLRSVKTKEKEVQRKVTYSSTSKLITSGFRFNKKRRNNRTGFPVVRRKPSIQKDANSVKDTTTIQNCVITTTDKTMSPDMFAVSSDSQEDTTFEGKCHHADLKQDETSINPETDGDGDGETEEEKSPTKRLSTVKSPTPTAKFNAYNRGRYQFEKYPKISIAPVASNMKTRSSDLQKRKSITPKKYSDSQQQSVRSPISSPNKYSPRKLRKPRGCWYKER